MRPLIRLWWGWGLKAIIYLDDGIVSVKEEHQAIEASTQVKLDLENAGFVINIEKSIWVPSQTIEWLGFHIDLAKGRFSVPSEKIEALKTAVSNVRETPQVPARKVASVIGKIITMSLGLGPITCLMTRSLYAGLNRWVPKNTLDYRSFARVRVLGPAVNYPTLVVNPYGPSHQHLELLTQVPVPLGMRGI